MTGAQSSRAVAIRWMKFNAVGALGIGVQVTALWLFAGVFRFDYLAATALAVETAVLHNFLWHERFTWADRERVCLRLSLIRLLRFNLSAGFISILGNLVLMRVLVGAAHLHYLAANLVAIAACSILNFVVSDQFVFVRSRAVRHPTEPKEVAAVTGDPR